MAGAGNPDPLAGFHSQMELLTDTLKDFYLRYPFHALRRTWTMGYGGRFLRQRIP